MIVVANKVDDERREADAWGFERLGLGDPYPVSALHGRGSGDLLDAVVAALPPEADAEADGRTMTRDDGIFCVAIVGRPNVGKSTLFNRLVGEERSVVHDLPGHDARQHRHDRRDRRRAAAVRRHRRDASPQPHRRADRVLQPRPRARSRSTGPTRRSSSSTRARASPTRTSGSPSGSTPPGTAIVIVLNKWDLRRRRRAAPRGPDRRRRPARVPRLRADPEGLGRHREATCATSCRRCARPRRRTTGGSRRRR